MSNSRLIAQDAIVQISDGGDFIVGGSYSFDSAITITAFAKSVKIKQEQKVVDLHGFGDYVERNRPTIQAYEVTCELWIENTGVVALGLGDVVLITVQPQSELSSFAYYGILTQNDIDMALDQGQTQTITIKSGYDAV